MMKPLLQLLASVIILQHVNGQCARRDYDHDSFVCVCNATYCDEAGVVTVPAAGTYAVYTSTRDALRLEPTTGEIEATPDAGGVEITVDTTNQYQTIIGFGSSFSDSAALNLNTLSDAARDNVLRSYFAAEGAEFTVSRVTIGGSDFSTRPYSLDDVEGDIALEFWSLAPEDIDAKIPNILRAMEISSSEIFILGSPWSPPAWMKSTGEVTGLGYLLPAMRQPYANFMVKWIDAYEAAGVPVWGFTPQNEPLTDETVWTINACKWLPEDMRDYIRDFLGPTLEAAGYADKKLMVFDFNRDKLPDYVMPLLSDPECSKYIAGVAAHWYVDDFIGPEVLLATRDLDPTKFLLHTEASTGVRQENPDSVYLGDWLRAEQYLYDILENLNYYSTGWVDWNMALDLNGGPCWPGGALDSQVIVNATADEFYKQPMHYALAHVSKFFTRDSVRVDTAVSGTLKAAAVSRPDGSVAIVVLSTSDAVESVSLSIDGSRFINTDLPVRSFSSFVVPPA
ncbi:putative glucosylceramidase 3 [Hyalella azteca]|uniref:Glucosylceramidase n=1 Tax=Hyalella azteca TaxID=294128 RepID=A0A8B7N5H9_HYAAZ|nr:putative glucosylceramidase 3 [Hyalella azteca]